MWWLGLPLVGVGLALTLVLRAASLSPHAIAAVGWMFALDAPLVAVAVFCYLAVLKARRVDVRQELSEDGFAMTLLRLSVTAHCVGALIGIVGSYLAPSIFLLGS
jgi:hypothetical protein